MNTYASRPLHLTTALAGLVLATLAVPSGASAKTPEKVDGVSAQIKLGTLEVRGSERGDAVALRLKAGDPTRVEVDVRADGSPDFSFARSAVSAIDVKTGDGNDSVDVDDSQGAFTNTIPTLIGGGAGDDSLNGGLGAETFRGGRGNDTVLGGKANDTASLGGGNDTFQWDPGDGSDGLEGRRGTDTMLFNGAGVNENMTLSAVGVRLVLLRDLGGVVMITDGVEAVDVNALGGTDNVTVNNLAGTDVVKTNVELAANLGGDAGDGAVDNVVVNATDGDDDISVLGSASGVDVTGLATTVSVRHPDSADTLSVNTLAGTDQVAADGVAGVMQVKVDGAAV